MPYLVICKRKLWFNVSPEKDEVADLTFHFPQVFNPTHSSFRRLLLFSNMQNCHDPWPLLCLHIGDAQVPTGIPQLHQRGHDHSGWAALQGQSRFGQVAVCHDPQNAEGAGSCWPDKNHVPRRMEEGKGRDVQKQAGNWWHVHFSPKKWKGKRTSLLHVHSLFFSLLCVLLAAHHLRLQQAERHHDAGGQNRLPETHFKLADLWLCVLWS